MNELRERARAGALPSGFARDRSFHFSSPGVALTSADAGSALLLDVRATVADDASRALRSLSPRGRAPALVAGAIPFDARRAARLRLYEDVREAERSPRYGRESGVYATQVPTHVSSRPTADGYREAVARAVASIRAGDLKKVVLARALDVELRYPIELASLLSRLRTQNPGKYVFSCDVSAPGGEPRTLLGASPELLLAKHGADVVSHPLAGSLPRSAEPAEDRALAARLVDSPKNLREHALVVEAVGDTLAPLCRTLNVPRRPSLVQTATMWHLGTKVSGQLRDASVSSLALALALHPTPAVCGEPRAEAAAAIAALEGFERGFFAGCVGYTDAAGDGEWAVTIRCAEASERTLRLYAGAGIVADSVPEDELAETSAKLRTMVRALGFELEGV